jgi:hypothetical protein
MQLSSLPFNYFVQVTVLLRELLEVEDCCRFAILFPSSSEKSLGTTKNFLKNWKWSPSSFVSNLELSTVYQHCMILNIQYLAPSHFIAIFNR